MSVADIDRAVNAATDQRYKQLTKQELLRSLVRPFDRFDVHASKLIDDDGRQKLLVKLEGILPVQYKGVVYNIPMLIWLPADFPYDPPVCYVRPVSNMVLSEQCPLIDRAGRVARLTTLNQWNHDKTSLTDVFRDMALQFGHSPPVFSKRESVPPQSKEKQPARRASPGQLPEDILKKSLVSAVLDKARRKLTAHLHEQKSEIAILKRTESELIAGQRQLNELMNAMNKEESRLTGYINTAREKLSEMSQAVDQMKKQQQGLDGDLLGKIFLPATPLHGQIVRLYTEDVAIQDVLFYIGEGHRRGTVSLSHYLRFVRELSRRQFFIRATLLKAKRVAGL